MKSLGDIGEAAEVRRRAAEVRKSWTVVEKRRRMGLPPDAPRPLREYILGCPTHVWQFAGSGLRCQ
jgi:hypothetical protein